MTTLPSTLSSPNRTIKEVRDMRLGGILVNAANLLDGLTTASLSTLRHDVGEERAQNDAAFRCGQCNEPVYINGGEGLTGDGRSTHFSHYAKGDTECAWRSGDKTYSQGGCQYDGLQEGLEHQLKKQMLVDVLRYDPNITGIELEKRHAIGPRWRRPDVSASYNGQPVAFELQLARLPLQTMIEREAFYREAGMMLIWVTTPSNVYNLGTQSFRDLYFQAGGRIFAIDATCLDRSRATSQFHLVELSLKPWVRAPYALFNRWSRSLVGPDVIFMPQDERHAEGIGRYGQSLSQQVSAQAPGSVVAINDCTKHKKGLACCRDRLERAGATSRWPRPLPVTCCRHLPSLGNVAFGRGAQRRRAADACHEAAGRCSSHG
ncbi:DUF6035 family protein [Devosia sp.]|uniref:competence protein CoiA family protein n=1 Tax=Devosia sp. TaxID=1871048 RepID=UPI0025FC23EE|nr:DUF6035 family protein [Devosia sp.]MCR6634909.1 competence protein CoiA [Devosia sp.]